MPVYSYRHLHKYLSTLGICDAWQTHKCPFTDNWLGYQLRPLPRCTRTLVLKRERIRIPFL